MGIGLIVVSAGADTQRVLRELADQGESGAVVLGRIVPGDRDVRYTS
jgi:hypothetical protein